MRIKFFFYLCLFLVQEENDLNMSTIGEQSTVENGEMGEEQLFQDSEEQQPWSNIESTADDGVLGAQSQPGLDSNNMEERLEDTVRSRTRCKTAKIQVLNFNFGLLILVDIVAHNSTIQSLRD